MGAPNLRLIDMASRTTPPRTTAEKIVLVNVIILAICIPLLIFCLVQQLWFPAVVFAFLSFSNGFQLWTAKRPTDRPPND